MDRRQLRDIQGRMMCILVSLLTLFCVTSVMAQRAFLEIQAPKQVNMHESFTVTITLNQDDRDDVNGLNWIAWRPYVFLLGHQQVSEVTFINGKKTSQTRWILTLQAKSSGTLKLPSITSGSYRSRPLQLTVRDQSLAHRSSQKQQMVSLQAAVDTDVVRVDQPLIYRIKIRSALPIVQGVIQPPFIDGIALPALGDQMVSTTTLDGQKWHILERHFLLVATRPGQLMVPKATFIGQVEDGSRAQDPFGFFVTAAVRSVRASGPNIPLTIKPPIDDAQHRTWLPAQDVRMSQSMTWQDDQDQIHRHDDPSMALAIQAGKPITWRRQIDMTGQVASRLPPLGLPKNGAFKVYHQPRQVSEAYMNGQLQTRVIDQVVLIAQSQHPLDVSLDETRLSWWHWPSRSWKQAHLPGYHLRIKPNMINDLKTNVTKPSMPLSKAIVSPQAKVSNVQIKSQNIGTPSTPIKQASMAEASSHGSWFASPALPWYLTFVFAALWMVTWYHKSTDQGVSSRPKIQHGHGIGAKRRALNSSLRTLQKACQQGDAVMASEQVLYWAQIHLGNDRLLHFADIIDMIDDAPLHEALKALQKHLYAHQVDVPWDGHRLYEAVDKIHRKAPCRSSTDDVSIWLAPFYPSHDKRS